MTDRVATIGMFDGFHLGHRIIIDELKKQAERHRCETMVISFANHPLSVVRPEIAPCLLTPGEEKLQLLQQAGIDIIELPTFDNTLRQMTAKEFLHTLRSRHNVTTLIMGFNNRFGSDRGLTFDDYRLLGSESGIDILRAPEYRRNGLPVNSTAIRAALNNGEVKAAGIMLGRPYTVTGTVVKGNQLGRTIGFPTANIQPYSSDKLIPANGVYACMAKLPDGISYPAMVNIGLRPTVNSTDKAITIEAHIDGIDLDLYGKEISVKFIEKMRDEQKFNGLDQLKCQLNLDMQQLRNIITHI